MERLMPGLTPFVEYLRDQLVRVDAGIGVRESERILLGSLAGQRHEQTEFGAVVGHGFGLLSVLGVVAGRGHRVCMPA